MGAFSVGLVMLHGWLDSMARTAVGPPDCAGSAMEQRRCHHRACGFQPVTRWGCESVEIMRRGYEHERFSDAKALLVYRVNTGHSVRFVIFGGIWRELIDKHAARIMLAECSKKAPFAVGKDCAISSSRFVDKSVRGRMLNGDMGGKGSCCSVGQRPSGEFGPEQAALVAMQRAALIATVMRGWIEPGEGRPACGHPRAGAR